MSKLGLEQAGAVGGILFVAFQLVGQALIQVGGSEPPFAASTEEIVEFFEARDAMLFNIGSYLSTLSLIPLLGFLGSLWSALRRAEGETGWLTLVAVGSGLLFLALIGGGGFWHIAVFRVDDGLDPQVARLLFDLGNFTFATMWVVLGVLVFAVGLSAIWYNAFAKWLGWSSLVLGVALVLARTIWTSSAAFGPYALFWVWLIVVGVILFRRARSLSRAGG